MSVPFCIAEIADVVGRIKDWVIPHHIPFLKLMTLDDATLLCVVEIFEYWIYFIKC